jgi:hypothetical protein
MEVDLFPIARNLQIALVGLQAFQVLFLWIHDWIPLGRLNDVEAVRRVDSTSRLVFVTLLQSVPFTVGLAFSVVNFGRSYPHWLYSWLWIGYAVLMLGQIRAWWIPYLVQAEPKRAERYRVMFGKTHSFLPENNGMVPNTAHVLLHLATAATLVVLLLG